MDRIHKAKPTCIAFEDPLNHAFRNDFTPDLYRP